MDSTDDEDFVPCTQEEIDEMERAELAQKPWLRPEAIADAQKKLKETEKERKAVEPEPLMPPKPPLRPPSDGSPSPVAAQATSTKRKKLNRSAVPRGPNGEMPHIPGRPPMNGVEACTEAVHVGLTRAESSRLDRIRLWASRADATARMAGLRFDRDRGWSAEIRDTGFVLEREGPDFRVLRGGVAIASFPMKAWFEAVLRASHGGG